MIVRALATGWSLGAIAVDLWRGLSAGKLRMPEESLECGDPGPLAATCDKPAGHHDPHEGWVDYGGEERREEWHDDEPAEAAPAGPEHERCPACEWDEFTVIGGVAVCGRCETEWATASATEAAPKGGTPEPEPGSEEDEIGILCDRLADAMDNAPGHDVVARWSMQQREAPAAWAASPSAPRPAFIG